MLREVRFHNTGEQTGTAHFYPLCSSSTCTGEINPSKTLENTFELKKVTERVNFTRARRACSSFIICENNPSYYVNSKVLVSLLQACNSEQTPNLCFSRERCVLARVCFRLWQSIPKTSEPLHIQDNSTRALVHRNVHGTPKLTIKKPGPAGLTRHAQLITTRLYSLMVLLV